MRSLVSAVILILSAMSVFTQSPAAAKPSFEVATIKRNASLQGGSRQGDQPGGPIAGPDTAADPSGLSIFTAIQDQLGLKLESTKGPVTVLVIDIVQRSSQN
jgi:hypothetical protein